MSKAYYETGGLRFWTSPEIEFREYCIQRLFSAVSIPLLAINRGWVFERCEGPILTAMDRLSGAYTEYDVFMTAQMADKEFCLRPETTPSSYEVARRLIAEGGSYRPPLCIWQAGKSFRRELSDGATAAKLRFNEFWQVEFQCIYAANSKADYAAVVIPCVQLAISSLTGKTAQREPSDRLPSYSESTIDIVVPHNFDEREMASISIRTDFADDMKVLEVAVGLDRLVEVANL